MARIAVEWGVRDLAAAACLSTNTVARFERGEELKPATVEVIRAALEAAGVEFIERGVRLREDIQPSAKPETAA
ncbi:transcriptional regulator [Magnetospirillum fulvum]|uniref:transcriptional regulator n=1 Tax=Magnetospirillum fulvum TaxID=1082 RepID=UPI0009428BF8|nr:transcriptional regulator [Magnetospirillum fulvum]